ncbi:aminoglycoside N(3)-acetyltransferase [Spirillospora sp. CA-294931]|uniref:aminoglycoside N(3)-acetyltransferase n=1 Tax=Spirillospora sp. CA-294931 TaxID=3240042 RepID=UPI003D939214
MRPASFDGLAGDLRALGIRAGRHLLVHCSLRRIGPVDGGAATVMDALREAIGPDACLVVPAFTPENSGRWAERRKRAEGMTPGEYAALLEAMPGFDRDRTPAPLMGMLAEEVRKAPGAVRSVHPQTSFAALGPGAADLVDDHDPDCHLGERSPLARLYEADADILLLGVGFEVCSAFHLAEYRYRDPTPTRTYRCKVMRDGRPVWREYRDAVVDDSDFGQIGADLRVGTNAVFYGPVGHGRAYRVSLPRAVDFAVKRLADLR